MSARAIVIRLVFSTVSTVGLSILFYIRPRRLPLATLGGFLTYAVYLLVHTVLASEFVCNMLASLAGALYAELLARRTRVPVTVYTIPCVIPLVPGSVLYRTMSSLVQSRLSDAVSTPSPSRWELPAASSQDRCWLSSTAPCGSVCATDATPAESKS